MDRKSFLQACGGVVAGGLTAQVPLIKSSGRPGPLPLPSKALWQFYGTADGKIFTRATPDDPWTLHADFGSDYGIYVIYRKGNDILVDVGHNSDKFTLKLSPNGKFWLHATQ